MRQVLVWWLRNLWDIGPHNRVRSYTSYFKLSFSFLKFRHWPNPQSMKLTLPLHFPCTNSPAMPRKVHQIRSQESWVIILDTDPFLICGLIFPLSQMKMLNLVLPCIQSFSYCVSTKNKALALYSGDSQSKDKILVLRIFTVQ